VFAVPATNKQTIGLYPRASIPVKNSSDAIGNIVAAKKQVTNNPK
jgi:hypothetical protein